MRAEAFGDAGFRELGQLFEIVDAPGFEGFRQFFVERETCQVEMIQLRSNRDAGEIVRGEDGGFGGFGDGDVDLSSGAGTLSVRMACAI